MTPQIRVLVRDRPPPAINAIAAAATDPGRPPPATGVARPGDLRRKGPRSTPTTAPRLPTGLLGGGGGSLLLDYNMTVAITLCTQWKESPCNIDLLSILHDYFM